MQKGKADFDVIIAGGGPAGLSALLWCAELGSKAILLEKGPEFGGQLLWTHNAIRNYLGVEASNGREMRDKFLQQLENRIIERRTNSEIVEVDLPAKSIRLADGTIYSSRAIVIATGVRRRKLGIPGETEFQGRGILESGVKSLNEVRGKTVVIVGGGDAALENAIILSDRAERVIIVHRGPHLSARPEFVDALASKANIEVRLGATISSIHGDRYVDMAEIRHLTTGNLTKAAADAVLIRIGVEPNTDLFRGQIELDEKGCILADPNCFAGSPGVFAAGDVANRTAPTVSAAAGQGAIAARSVFAMSGRPRA